MRKESQTVLTIVLAAISLGAVVYSQTRIRLDQVKPEPVKLGAGTVGQLTQIALDVNGKRELIGVDIPAAANRKYGVDLSSQVDGMRVSFTTPDQWEINSEVVLYNGVRQRRGSDYTIVPNGSGNGTTISFAFVVPGTTEDGSSDTVVMDYTVAQ